MVETDGGYMTIIFYILIGIIILLVASVRRVDPDALKPSQESVDKFWKINSPEFRKKMENRPQFVGIIIKDRQEQYIPEKRAHKIKKFFSQVRIQVREFVDSFKF